MPSQNRKRGSVVCLILQRGDNILSRFVGHAVQTGQRGEPEPVEVSRCESPWRQPVDRDHSFLSPNSLIDSTALGKRRDGLLALGAANSHPVQR
jgi:hypothetical protein